MAVCCDASATETPEACPEDQSASFKAEEAYLGSVTLEDAKGVFFVRLFGGLWSVPDRYRVDGIGYGVINLHSPADFRRRSSDCSRNLIGYIRFGDYAEYKKFYAEKDKDA